MKLTIGMGCTINHYTDRVACSVISVSKSGKSAVIQQDTVKRVGPLGMCDRQEYEYTPNPDGLKHRVSLRKDGTWRISKGKGKMQAEQSVTIGIRKQYHDFNF